MAATGDRVPYQGGAILRVAIIVVIAYALLFAGPSHSHNRPAPTRSMEIVHRTDHAVRATQRCQREIGLRVMPTRRLYALPHSIGFRGQWLKRWRHRRNECFVALRRVRFERSWYGVPSWFVNLMVGCVHPKESINWYLDSHHDGGLQYTPGTWVAGGGRRYADFAYQATPAQQVRVAWNLTHGRHSLLMVHWGAQAECF